MIEPPLCKMHPLQNLRPPRTPSAWIIDIYINNNSKTCNNSSNSNNSNDDDNNEDYDTNDNNDNNDNKDR